MKRRNLMAGIAILVMATAVRPVTAEITDDQVRQAIDRGVEFLKSKQETRGNWPEYPGQPGGMTALCTLALLNAGVSPNDPALAQALNYLRSYEKPEMVYSVALRTMVFCAAGQKEDRRLIRQNAKWLETCQVTRVGPRNGQSRGAWAYSARTGSGDNSNTQFALLALNEAERVGIDVAQSTWRLALEYWESTQKPDGSWGYQPGMPSTGSMTCAGIASAVIAAGRIGSGRARVDGKTVLCCGERDESDAAERGLRWLARYFTVRANPGDRTWLLYYLYGVERVGRLTGRRLIGGHDWYREGAEMLVREQNAFLGYWRGVGANESNPVIATSLALLFLAKGRRPVAIAKAKYGNDGQWDQHAGGVPNLTRHLEQAWTRELTWQTIDLDVAKVEDLLEAPVLFLSGKLPLPFSAKQKDNLRHYVEQGGFIFAEASDGNGCDGKAFDRSFRDLMRELFPDSTLRLLPPDHAVWFAEGKVNPQYLRPLYGIDACCRTSVVYCPRTLSCFWELSAGERESTHEETVQAEIAACVQIGQNVVAYATNRILKEKLDRPTVTLGDGAELATSRGVLLIPKLGHSGGSDDAPNSLANLMRFARDKVELRALTLRRVLAPTADSLYEYPIVFIHGRHSFRWTADERAALAEYIQNGGFLFGDSICASPKFTAAFRRELEAVFPGKKLERIPVNHPLFSEEFGGFSLSRVTLNDPSIRQEGERLESRRTSVSPLLEGLQIDGRLAVVFSPYDLSCALESSASLECKGYIKTDAAKIGTNIILFALTQ